MTDEAFDAMLAQGLQQARDGHTLSIDEAFVQVQQAHPVSDS